MKRLINITGFLVLASLSYAQDFPFKGVHVLTHNDTSNIDDIYYFPLDTEDISGAINFNVSKRIIKFSFGSYSWTINDVEGHNQHSTKDGRKLSEYVFIGILDQDSKGCQFHLKVIDQKIFAMELMTGPFIDNSSKEQLFAKKYIFF